MFRDKRSSKNQLTYYGWLHATPSIIYLTAHDDNMEVFYSNYFYMKLYDSCLRKQSQKKQVTYSGRDMQCCTL